jgi:hypothetical protein
VLRAEPGMPVLPVSWASVGGFGPWHRILI